MIDEAHAQSREAEKSAAVAEINFVLEQLAEQRRNPDHWQSTRLTTFPLSEAIHREKSL